MDELLNEFLAEVAEQVEVAGTALVAWEAAPQDREKMDTIFRAMHTIKGSSSFFDMQRITALAHAAESCLDRLRSNAVAPTPAVIDAVLAAIEQLSSIALAAASTGTMPGGSDELLIAALDSDGAMAVSRPAPKAAAPVEAAIAASPATASPANQPPHVDSFEDAVASATGDGDVAAPAAAEQAHQPWRSVRVPVSLVANVMDTIADMVLAGHALERELISARVTPNELPSLETMSGLVGQLRFAVGQMRLVPIEQLFSGLPRLVRQTASELGKMVQLDWSGGETGIDREVIEALRDPLTHLLRNSVDHGIESLDDRVKAGKQTVGRILLTAAQSGNRILVRVRDDGRGIDIDKVGAKAREAGIVDAMTLERMDDQAKMELIFHPGLSTASSISSISGRGVGMDVVKSNIERIGGSVRIESTVGQGTTLIIDVPMTLAVFGVLMCNMADQSYAIPRSAVEEVLTWDNSAIARVDGADGRCVRLRGTLLPVVSLASVLGMDADDSERDSLDDERACIICRTIDDGRFALDVPALGDHQEVVVRPLPPILSESNLFDGLSLPDSGEPVLLLDIAGVAKAGRIVPQQDDAAGLIHALGLADAADAQADMAVQWLRATRAHDRAEIVLPLALVDRIEDVSIERLLPLANGWVAHIDGQLFPMVAPPWPAEAKPDVERLTLMRLRGDDGSVAMLAVALIGDMVNVALEAGEFTAESGAPIVLVDDEPVEMLRDIRRGCVVGTRSAEQEEAA